MTDERDAVVSALLPLVRRVARRLKRLVPSLDVDDLIGDGAIGLIRAVDSFDPLRGPQLTEYARRLVVGAMLNGIRRMDPVSERARRIVRDGENQRFALAAVRGELPTAAEMEGRCPGDRRALAAADRGQPLSLDAPLPRGESVAQDWSDDPARIV
ncbi:MAG: sigma-70 family RNA polymerase sigma factor, partial [Candidatus Cybelea sp.]